MTDKNYWDFHARSYDASIRTVLSGPIPRMLQLVGSAVNAKDRALEVAAGTGLVTETIAVRCDTLIATDYSEGMLAVLKERVDEKKLVNVTCEQADVDSLKFASREFDLVVAANVLHLVPDVSRAISALRRVLQPSGTLVVPTFCHDETRVSRILSKVLSVSGFPGQRRFTQDTLIETLSNNGLSVTRTEMISGLIPIGYVEGVFVDNPDE